MKNSDMKKEWDLGLLYKSHHDPQIEKDTQALEVAYESFEKKYKNDRLYLTDEQALFNALTEWQNLMNTGANWKPGYYLFLAKEINSADSEAEAKGTLLTNRITKVANKVIFFTLSLGKIEKNLQVSFLKSEKLSPFRYYLKHIFENSKHDLSEAEEKILNLKSLPSYSLWLDGQSKLLNKQTLTLGGKKLPMSEVMNKIPSLPQKIRRETWKQAREKLKNLSDFSEAEINAICTDKKINDELRGFEKPYSATILSYQNAEQTVLNLVKTVSDSYPVAHRFYKLKAKLHKLKHLEFADRAADLGKISRKVPFTEALEIVNTAFGKVSPEYRAILNGYLTKGQIDIFPKKNKRGGAFCISTGRLPTYVLLNHSDTVDSVMTFGHEMGHAIHAEFSSKNQPALYQGTSISVAETASTLFENFVFEEIFEKLSEKEKIIALHDRINDAMLTVFTQIACFQFELALHEQIREKGTLSKEKIAELLNEKMTAQLGSAVKMHPDDGYRFVWWVHIRYFFYTYSYAYGFLISRALYARYKQDPNSLIQIEQFLSAGSSKSSEDIFKDIGIDVTKPEFFADGIKGIEADIIRLEKLAKKAKMI